MDKLYQKKPEESFEEYCHRISALKDEINATWTTIASIVNEACGVNYSADKYRKTEKRYINALYPSTDTEDLEVESDFTPSYNDKATITTNYDKGETTSARELPLTDKQLNNPEELLKAHGFNPEDWSIKTASNAKTTRLTADGNTYIYVSRITVKPKDSNEITFSDIDKYFESFDTKRFSGIKVTPKQYDASGEFLEICLQDVHMGLLSYEQETGEDYDVAIAKQRLQNCMSDIYQRCRGRKFKRIVLVLLGDIMHVDNLEGTTTKGTRQDVDTRPTRIFDEALNSLINVVETLGNIAPVEVINIQGNHDRLSSYMLAKALEMSFRGDKNVTFFNGPNPRKWRRYGKVLLGYAHGDMKPNAVSEWLSNECDEWSNAKYREVHLGHLHSIQTIQKIEDNKYGLIVRYLPAICASSAWEHEMGFPKSERGMMSFVWNEDTGLREVWYSNI